MVLRVVVDIPGRYDEESGCRGVGSVEEAQLVSVTDDARPNRQSINGRRPQCRLTRVVRSVAVCAHWHAEGPAPRCRDLWEGNRLGGHVAIGNREMR